jgi:hypothetical protein
MIVDRSEDTTVADAAKQQKKRGTKPPGGSRNRAALLVALACVTVAAVVISVNSGRLVVQSHENSGVQKTVETADAAPVIVGISGSTERIEPSDVCDVVCDAHDEDGDVLTYTWSASQGEIVGQGASAEWTAPDSEGLFRISVVVDDGRGGTASSSVSLGVKQNYAPDIEDLTASAEVVPPGASAYLSCSASDDDGDEITYEWETTSGELYGEGNAIVWLAPTQPGPYWVTVYARDGYGGEATRAVAINVSAHAAPELARFRVKGVDDGDLLSLKDGVWDVFKGSSVSIRCVVKDGADPFDYEWSVDYGTLTAEGDTAVWDAPMEQGPATVIVDVTDANGSTTRGTVLLYVETCTCAFK